MKQRVRVTIIFMFTVIVIVPCMIPVLAAEPNFSVAAPGEDWWEPDPKDIAYISRTVWGECRGCCEIEQRAQAWCILNRVDDPRFPDSIEAVVTAKYQFQGYSQSNPVEPFAALAREILILWHDGKREIPEDVCWCSGDGKHQMFRNSWIVTQETEFYP